MQLGCARHWGTANPKEQQTKSQNAISSNKMQQTASKISDRKDPHKATISKEELPTIDTRAYSLTLIRGYRLEFSRVDYGLSIRV